MDDCVGWLQGFKVSHAPLGAQQRTPHWLCVQANVIQLQCGAENCWDAIDVIQFHAYFYNSSELIAKVCTVPCLPTRPPAATAAAVHQSHVVAAGEAVGECVG